MRWASQMHSFVNQSVRQMKKKKKKIIRYRGSIYYRSDSAAYLHDRIEYADDNGRQTFACFRVYRNLSNNR